MKLLSLLQQRRSIRKYTSEAVAPEQIKQILTAALMAPAGKRLNPWEFVVVEDRAVLSQMSACRTYGSQLLENSPLGIVVCADTTVSDTWKYDAAIAAILMQLEATDLGLGSCWVQVQGRTKGDGESAEGFVRSLLNIPDKYAVLCVVSIGHIDEERKPFDLEKLQYEKIHYGSFGEKRSE